MKRLILWSLVTHEYMAESSLFQMMACRVFGAKPFQQPVFTVDWILRRDN